MEELLGKYQHYKGNFYEVIGIARFSENPSQEFVVYRTLYKSPEFGENQLWIMPMALFFEEVLINGVKVPRFKKVK
ncbi:MAG TPA: DUF1653 domain-containing protein [Candidatus Nanoarchaeia archaeon]|nr:DUF1653 domain-containing protein [Candidatus Nanoarchaeia archaeon]